MRKVLLAATLVLLATSFAFGQTSCTLTFLTESVPDFPIGHPVHFDFEVCCGTAPYTFVVVDGTLEAGLILLPNGKLRGRPLELGDNTVFIKVVDAAGCSLTQAFPIRVVP
jgi:hypothetical protein